MDTRNFRVINREWTKRARTAVMALMLAGMAPAATQARPMDLTNAGVQVNFQQIYWFAQAASDAYASQETIRDQHPGVSWIATPGHVNVLYYVQTDHARKQHVVSVRGTVDDTNWQLDKDTHGAFDEQAGVLLHRGFHKVAQAIQADLRSQIKPTYRAYFTGHSLGGAVAAILATYMDRQGYSIGGVYTFGQPKFTNAEGVKRFANLPVLRVVYQNDAVAMLPDKVQSGNGKYAHVGPEVVLLSGPYYSFLDENQAARKSIGSFSRGIRFASLPDHKIKWYLQGLRDKLQASKRVPYSQRQRYVKRHKLGTGADTAPVTKRTNFNRHHPR